MPTHFRRSHLLGIVCALCSIFTLSSCYTTRNYLQAVEEDLNNTYKYCTVDYVIEQQGKPTRIETGSNGSQVVIYEEFVNASTEEALVDATTDTPAFVQTDGTRKYLEFYFGPDSRCYDVKTNHTQRVAKRERAKPSRRGLIWGISGAALLLIEGIVFMYLELG